MALPYDQMYSASDTFAFYAMVGADGGEVKVRICSLSMCICEPCKDTPEGMTYDCRCCTVPMCHRVMPRGKKEVVMGESQ